MSMGYLVECVYAEPNNDTHINTSPRVGFCGLTAVNWAKRVSAKLGETSTQKPK